MTLEILPLTPQRFADLAALFSSGGDARWCWCMWWRMRARDFSMARVPELRAKLRALTEATPPPGLVALAGDRAVGWVSLGPRSDFERLQRSRTIPRIDEQPVWSIVCFAVSETARGQGVARRLLEAAVTHAGEQGATILEAYPVAPAAGARISADAAFSGTLDLFVSAGFQEVAPTRSSSGGSPRVVVRLDLRVSGPIVR